MLLIILALLLILLANPKVLGYFGLAYCFVVSAIGTGRGIWIISTYVSGTSIKAPEVGPKSILGTVVCEANFLSGIISCILTYGYLKGGASIQAHYLYFCSSIFVGICNYFSSISTGLICSVISMMDGKDRKIFFKVVALEVMPASIGLIGFILGIILNSKAKPLR